MDDIAQQFQTYAELSVYSAAQHETITKLNAKINQLEAQTKHLEKLLADNSIIVGTTESLKDMFIKCDDPEGIARMQLKILRDKSIGGELSMEESKRVEIYTKILNDVEARRKDKMKDVTKEVSTEELLKLVSNENNGHERNK